MEIKDIKLVDLIEKITGDVKERCSRVESGEIPTYTFGGIIYRISAKPLLDYRLSIDEKPVLPYCRAGFLFHEMLYRTDDVTLRRALDQIFNHTKTVVVTTVNSGGWGRKEQEYFIHS